MKIAEVLNAYISMRDTITKKEREFKDFKKDVVAKMDMIELFLAKQCDVLGLDNLKGGGHTAFKKPKDSVTIDDKPEFKLAIATGMAASLVELGLVEAGEAVGFAEAIASSESFDLLTLSANKINCKSYMADHKGLMPNGVSYFKENTIQVRKGN
jgi:hypothetical protein